MRRPRSQNVKGQGHGDIKRAVDVGLHVGTTAWVAGVASAAAGSYTGAGARAVGAQEPTHGYDSAAQEGFPTGEARLSGQRRQEDQRNVQTSQPGIFCNELGYVLLPQFNQSGQLSNLQDGC